MEDAVFFTVYIVFGCFAGWLFSRVYSKGVQKGVALALNNIEKMHCTIDILSVDGKGSVELQFVRAKDKKNAL